MKSQPYKQVNNKHANNGPTNNNITSVLGYQKETEAALTGPQVPWNLMLLNDLSIEIHEHYNPRNNYNDTVKRV